MKAAVIFNRTMLSPHVFCAKRRVSLFLLLEPKDPLGFAVFPLKQVPKEPGSSHVSCRKLDGTASRPAPSAEAVLQRAAGSRLCHFQKPADFPLPSVYALHLCIQHPGPSPQGPVRFLSPLLPQHPCPATLVILSPLTRFLITACLCGLHFPRCERFSQGLSALEGLPFVPAVVWCLLV